MWQQPKVHEQRRSERVRRSEVIFWRGAWHEEFVMGWTLEASDDGVAFAWRGPSVPSEGRHIEIQRGVGETGTPPDLAVIRRVTNPHADLVVIAVEILTRGPLTNAEPAPPEVCVPRLPRTHRSDPATTCVQRVEGIRRLQATRPARAA